jgi:hypothetical protein
MALVLPDGRACLDYLSRPEAYARHHRKLLQGYLLDAIEQLDRPAAEAVRANVVVAAVSGAIAARQPSAALGSDLRIKAAGIMASGLELDGEVLQLSAYTA